MLNYYARRLKLIHYLETGHDELYHLEKDLVEKMTLQRRTRKRPKKCVPSSINGSNKPVDLPYPRPFILQPRCSREHMKTNFKKGMEQKAAATSTITLSEQKLVGKKLD